MGNDIIKQAARQKSLQMALRKELRPLFIGLRNDLEALLREQKKTTAKEPPAIQKTKVTNQPDIQKVEQVNPQREVKILNPQKEVSVVGIKQLFGNLFNKQTQLAGKRDDTLTKLFAGLTRAFKAQVFKVMVQNQLELPPILKVEEQSPAKQKQLQDVRIMNNKPRDAVPVVLVSHDLKRFYDIMVQLVGGSSGGGSLASLAAILAALNKIDANTDQLELKADTVILNVDDLEALLGAGGATFHSYADIVLTTTTETLVTSFTFGTGKAGTVKFINFEGEGNATFSLFKNGTKVWRGRIEQAQPSDGVPVLIDAVAADLFELKVAPDVAGSPGRSFSGSLSGNEL